MTIILPIKPEFVKKILEKTKTIELRKSFPKEKINKILIYETKNKKQIVGEMKVIQEIMPKEIFFNKYQKEIGVSKEEFKKYYNKKDKVYAYKIKEVIKYTIPKSISEFGFSYPPQNFYYIKK